METTRLSDLRFFTECVDASIPALAALPTLAQAGRLEEAYRVFGQYVRTVLHRDMYLAPDLPGMHENRESVLAAAERVMLHQFKSCRVPYTFGPVIDWEFNPTYNAYKEWPWQLNRHPEWKALAQAYVLTGDDKYAKEWTEEFVSWAIQCQVPENESGYRTISWRTIECGIRMYTWALCIHAMLSSPYVTDEFITIFMKSIWEHGWRLKKDCTSHNWLIMEMNGLSTIGLFFPFFKESAQWLDYAHMRLKEEVDVQVYPDGMQFELSMGYHYVVVHNYEAVREKYARTTQAPPAYLEESLYKLYNCYPKLARPDLNCPTMNDGGTMNAPKVLRKAIELYPEREDYRYFATERAEGKEPEYHSVLMEYGGAVIFRDSWAKDAYWAYMDASPFGRAHQHEDKLNVQIYALGHELLPEGGTFDYDASEMRKYVLSTRAHNTIRIDDADQNRRPTRAADWSPEDIRKKADVAWTISDARDTAEAAYTEAYAGKNPPVTHTRKLIFLKNEAGLPKLFIAVDRLVSADEEEHVYEAMWHLHDNPTTIVGRSVTNQYPDGVGITVALSAGSLRVARGEFTPVFQGWLPKFGVGDVEHYPIPTVLNRGKFTGSVRLVTVLCPYADGKPMITAVEASSDVNDTTLTITLADGSAITITE